MKKKQRDDFSFKYRPRSVDDIKKRANQTGGRFDVPVKPGFDMWRPKDGENVVRILPATWDPYDHYGLEVHEHRFIGADNSNYICLNKMKDKPCPACEEYKELKDAGEDEDAKKIGEVKRVWYYIIDRDDRKARPQIWDVSWTQDRDIAGLTYNERTGRHLLIENPDDGFDLIINKKGKGLKTKYTFAIERESSPISEDPKEQKSILRFISDNPLPDVMRYDSAEYIEKQLSGTSKHRDEDLDDDDDDRPKRKRRRRDEDEDETPRRRARRRDDEDEDDEDETPRRKRRARDDDDDDDDDVVTKRKRRSHASNDDGWDEDEDDDDETPRTRRKARDADDDDDRPKRKRRRRDEDEDEDERPKKRNKRRVVDEDDDDEDDDD